MPSPHKCSYVDDSWMYLFMRSNESSQVFNVLLQLQFIKTEGHSFSQRHLKLPSSFVKIQIFTVLLIISLPRLSFCEFLHWVVLSVSVSTINSSWGLPSVFKAELKHKPLLNCYRDAVIVLPLILWCISQSSVKKLFANACLCSFMQSLCFCFLDLETS